MKTQNVNTAATSTSTANKKAANKTRKTATTRKNVAQKQQDNVAEVIENVATMEVVKTDNVATEKTAIVRKTAAQKVEDLKASIVSHFGVTQEQLTAFTIARLSKSSRKTNLIDFHENLIVELVTKPATLAKILG